MAPHEQVIDPSADKQRSKKSAISEQLSFWVGLLGSIVTIGLTVWNTHTKAQIDQREAALKNLEMHLKERSTGIEESKERVDRYKWVLSLFPALNGKDPNEKNFTLNIARLALTKDEAEQLFAGLQSSNDTVLQSIGQAGIQSIQSEPITVLIGQMNAATAEVRKSAVATLSRNYASTPQAITLTLRTYDENQIGNLSPSAIINGLYFLAATDPAAWDKQQLAIARQLVLRIEAMNPGEQTRAALNAFKNRLSKVEAALI